MFPFFITENPFDASDSCEILSAFGLCEGNPEEALRLCAFTCRDSIPNIPVPPPGILNSVHTYSIQTYRHDHFFVSLNQAH